jgi:DNA-3-methyladenine glycosylase II
MPSLPLHTHNAKAWLQQDPVMANLIDTHTLQTYESQQDLYLALLRSITGQQLSTKVAAIIYKRLIDYFGDYPNPTTLLSTETDELRGLGLSYKKVEYIKNVARYKDEGNLEWAAYQHLSDEDIIEKLTGLPGIGVWTAQMLLMFEMNRPDVLPLGDLGIRNAAKNLYALNASGKVLEKEIIHLAEAWRPYRTLACRYLWASLNNMPAQ